MRAVKAKRLRKEVHGDLSLNASRRYVVGTQSSTIRNKAGTMRAVYQNLKK